MIGKNKHSFSILKQKKLKPKWVQNVGFVCFKLQYFGQKLERYSIMNKIKQMKRILVTALLIGCTQANAQDKMLSIEDAVLKQRTVLAPEKLNQLQWIPGTDKFGFTSKQNNVEILLTEDATTLKIDTILNIQTFNYAWRNLNKEAKDMAKFPAITFVNGSTFRFQFNNAIYHFNLTQNTCELLAKAPFNAENLDYEPNSQNLAYTLNNQLWLHQGKTAEKNFNQTAEDKREIITTDGSPTLHYGKAVHRNEFGINKGTFFSNSGKQLAFYKMNEEMVSDYQTMNFDALDTNHLNLTKPSKFHSFKYPMAGNKSHEVKVLVYDSQNKRTVELQTGLPAEQYLTNIAWSPNDEFIYIAHVNRAQNEMNLKQYDAKTGAFIRLLFTEKHDKYVEPEKPILFTKNNTGNFIWMSERDGFNHLYLYNKKGELIRQLTKGSFAVTDILGFNENGEKLFYAAYTDQGMHRFSYVLDLKTAQSHVINGNPGVHQTYINSKGTHALDQFSNLYTPRRIVLHETNGKELATILNATNPLKDYKKCEIQTFTIASTDKTVPLNCRMILPPQFDATKKYPVIVYVYGGPHVQLISDSWLGQADMWLYYMAQQGYITFSLDNRGSLNRGLNFENAIHRNLGKLELEDQLAGIQFLKSKPYVDSSKMGVFGWSFGGFMSTSLMLKTPDIFKAGVAGGPVIDWRYYEIMYTERYMDQPQENPLGYQQADLLGYTKNLKGKLLMIHGTSDDVVLWQHSLQFVKKCVEDGILIDYFVYPEHLHNVMGNDRVHLMRKITQYFNENLAK